MNNWITNSSVVGTELSIRTAKQGINIHKVEVKETKVNIVLPQCYQHILIIIIHIFKMKELTLFA